ncbi:hypothetical protein MalM25_12290 [Planctomycetes bacterium MalM25]|nr:hypothetical protein MalM25_12290 [Planctomycetes bacterium MalM25]
MRPAVPAETTSPEPTPAIKTPSGRFWFESLLVFLVLLVAVGDPAPMVNEAHYLCRLKHYWNPEYCPGDLFLESPDAHFTVVWLFGWVTRFLSLPATAWLGRVISWALLAVAWRRLVGRVSDLPFLAPLSAGLLWLGVSQGNLAGEWIFGGFEAKSLAYGFVLLGLTDAIDARWNRAWVLLGVASAMHALVGGWSVVALGAVWLTAKERPKLPSMAPGLLAGGLLSLAGVLPALALNTGANADQVHEADNIYVHFRLPHHLALLSKGSAWLANRAGRHAVVVALLAMLTWARAASDRRSVHLLIRFAWAAEAISLIGLVIGWIDPPWGASVLKYYWHRLADIAAPMAVALLLIEAIDAGWRTRRGLAALSTFALTLVVAWNLGGIAAQRSQRPIAPCDKRMRDPAAWREMGDWVRENTEPDALLLVPQTSQSFKWHAERGEVVTRKDIPQDALSMIEWRRRLSDIFQIGEWADGTTRWTPSYAHLGAGRLRELAEAYGADYALDQATGRDAGMPLRHRASLPIVHRVGPYTLYDLRDE